MRVLFTSTAGWGHVHPMVPLATAFVDQGDEVLWATSAEGCGRLQREGFATAPCGLGGAEAMAEFDRRFPEYRALPPAERPPFMFPKLFGAVRAEPMLDELTPIAAKWSPTILVTDAAEFAGHIVAAQLEVPSVTHSFGSLLPSGRVAAAGEEVATLWRSRGLRPRPFGGCYDHLYLDIYPPSLQPDPRPHVPATQPLRPGSFATAGDEEVPEWVIARSESPLIYVTLGTVFTNDAVFGTVLEAIRELPIRVVATVGPHGDPAAVGTQPANVHVARYIAQDRLLTYCTAVISHGGSGTFLAALASALPQMCLPQAADQFSNAAACVHSGCGIAIQPDVLSAELIHTGIKQLLSDPQYRQAAQTMSDEIVGMLSPVQVAQHLHQIFG